MLQSSASPPIFLFTHVIFSSDDPPKSVLLERISRIIPQSKYTVTYHVIFYDYLQFVFTQVYPMYSRVAVYQAQMLLLF